MLKCSNYSNNFQKKKYKIIYIYIYIREKNFEHTYICGMNIRQIDFNDYYTGLNKKSQIYLHHTAGGPNAESVWNWWSNDRGKIGTCVVISQNGEIVQGFSSRYWAYHLGLRTGHFAAHGLPYKNLDKTSIGIELCNWGWLTQRGGEFYTYTGHKLPAERVIKLDKPFRGHEYWEAYTDEQIESVRELLLLWRDRYGIDLTYNEDIWDVTKRALTGQSGVFTHNSVRPDKTDCAPQENLISALKEL